MQLKLKRLKTFLEGLDAFIDDPNEMLFNKDWIVFFQNNSKILHNDLGTLKGFRDWNSQIYIDFTYSFLKFVKILDIKMFDVELIFKNFPDLLYYTRQHPKKGLESCLIEMIQYMKKILMPIDQEWSELFEKQTGETLGAGEDNLVDDLTYFA